MKKLLLVAILMLALVFTVVACNNNEPADTTAGETTVGQVPGTAEPAPETEAPEVPTEAPEVPTEAPEVPTEPETTVDDTPATQAPVVTTEPETEAPVDPMAPINVFNAADISGLSRPHSIGSAEVVDNYLHIVPNGTDPYWYPFSSVDGGRFVAIRYRTADATNATMQVFIGSTGNGPSNDDYMTQIPLIVDGEWHLAILDTQEIIEKALYDGSYVSFLRFDPLESGYVLDENGEPYKGDDGNWVKYPLPEGCSVDVEYIAFFDSAEAAEKYDADTHFVVPPHDDVTLTLGTGHGAPFCGAGDKKFGHRGQIGENFLKNVTINELATYSDGNTNTWSFKVWQWNTDYATTVAGEPLFVANGENHADNSNFSIDIPAELGIRGDIYYEIEYLSGSGGFTGWTADADSVTPGLETYVAGNLVSGSYSASITVGVAKPTKYDNYAPAIDTWTVSGHCPQIVGKDGHANSPMVAAGGVEFGALLHQGSIALGEIDLSKYDKVVIYYGVDNSDVTWGRYNENPANRIMLVSADMSMVNSPEENTIIAGATYEPCGWGVQAFEIDLTNVDYNGPVFVTYDTLPGTFMLFSAVEFIGGDIAAEPEEPETPVVELTPFTDKFHANVDFINGGSKDGAGVPYQGLGTSTINGTNGVLAVRNAAEDNIVVNADYTINLQGWMGVLGGINHYAYSVNGGALITAVGGADGEPLADYYVGLGMADSTKMGLFNGGNMLVADLSAYAGQTVTVTFYAIPEAAQDTVAPIVSIEGLVIPEAANDDPTDLIYNEYTANETINWVPGGLTIDADYTDWFGLNASTIGADKFVSWVGATPENYSMITGFAADSDYLYAVVYVADDSVVAGNKVDNAYNGDVLQLAITMNGKQSWYSFSYKAEGVNQIINTANTAVAGAELATVALDGAWLAELKLPISVLVADAGLTAFDFDAENPWTMDVLVCNLDRDADAETLNFAVGTFLGTQAWKDNGFKLTLNWADGMEINHGIIDPMAPVNVFKAEDMKTDGQKYIQSLELKDGYMHVVPSDKDPNWKPFSKVDGARYVVVRYRTSDATGAKLQFFMGSSGNNPKNDNSMLEDYLIVDGEWHLLIFDAQELVDRGEYDGKYVSYFRLDPLEAGYILDENGEPQKDENGNWYRNELPAGCSIDIAYVGFFHTVEAAEKYDAENYPATEAPVENYNVPMESWTISGHQPQLITPDVSGIGPIVAAAGLEKAALLHQGSVGVGAVDLSKYSKVVIQYTTDASQPTYDLYNASGKQIYVLNAQMHMVNSPEAATVITSATFALPELNQNWVMQTIEIDLSAIDYSGDVFIAWDTLAGSFMVIASVEFVA